MGKKKAVSVYFEESLLNEVKEYSETLGSRQFNRVVGDACRELLRKNRAKTNYGSVYAVYFPALGLTKVGSSRVPNERVANIASDLGESEYESYVSERMVHPALWEFICHWELSLMGFHNEKEFFSCSLRDAVRVIESSKPDSCRAERFKLGSGRKFSELCANYGILTKDASNAVGFSLLAIGHMVKDEELAESVMSNVLDKLGIDKSEIKLTMGSTAPLSTE